MADVVNDLAVKFWNGAYYCTVKFLDGTLQELKSATDLTYTQWQIKIKAAWEAHIAPQPSTEPCICPECSKEFVCPNRTI